MVALMLALQLSAAPQALNPAQRLTPATATIRGRVFAADTGQPLRKAQVRLTQIDAAPQTAPLAAGRENRLATTDADGKYEFADLPAGRFNLTASKSSYVPASWGQAQPNAPPKPLDVANGQTIERVDFSLSSGGVVTGRIVDEYGEPLSGVQVAPVRSQVVNGQRRMMPTGRPVGTDDLGEFRLFGIPPGQYYIQATWRRVGPPDPSSADQIGYPSTFFPGTTDVATAQRFTIAAGQTITDLAMAMTPIKTARVEGIVFDSNGLPAPNAMVTLLQMMNGAQTFGNGALGRPDGAFTFANVTPGEYVLRAQPRRDLNEIAILKLTVGNEDIQDLRLIALPPSTVTGRIVVDPAEAASLPPSLMITATPIDPTGGMFGIQPARVADDLSFEATAAVGRVRIALAAVPPSWAIRSVRVSGLDVTDDGIDVKAGERVSGVEVELTTKLASLGGQVTTSGGDPATDYPLVRFPADSRRWTAGSRYFRVGRPDQHGRFNLSSLPAGEYQAIALDKLEPGQNTDPDFLEKIRSRATSFTLMDGETKTIDLKLNSAS